MKFKKIAFVFLFLITASGCQVNPSVSLIITSNVDASISIDGVNLGYSPFEYAVSIGHHSVVASLDGYETQVRDIWLTGDEVSEKMFVLMPQNLPSMPAIPVNMFENSISPDNQWWVVDGESGIWISKTGEENWVSLLPDNTSGLGLSTRWSPDGRKLALNFPRGPIWVFDAGDWNHYQEIYTGDGSSHNAPEWSPDGAMMTFCEEQPNNTVAIYLWKSGEAPTIIIQPGEITVRGELRCFFTGPYWVPDSSHVIYYEFSYDENEPSTVRTHLWMLDVETLEKTMILEVDNVNMSPVWSSDGQTMFLIQRAKILTYSLRSGDLEWIDLQPSIGDLLDRGFSYSYNPSPNMQSIAITNNKGELFIVDMQTNVMHKIEDESVRIIRWTSDGSKLIVVDKNDLRIKYLPVE